MVEWEFVLNNQPMSKIKGGGVSLDASSGREAHFNRCEAACLRNLGPIRVGKYYIIDRPVGGIRGTLSTWLAGLEVGKHKAAQKVCASCMRRTRPNRLDDQRNFPPQPSTDGGANG